MSNRSKNQNPKSKIVIVGAGPAGASAAIRLAKDDFTVCLIERERFPRPKLCGEFISPECFRHFRDLNVFDEMLAAGGERIRETRFFAPNGKSVGVPSEWFNENEAGALSLSRAAMDLRLLEQAKAGGVEVLEDYSVADLLYKKDKIGGVKVRAKNGNVKEISADLFIDATGRHAVLGKMARRRFGKQKAANNGRQTKLVGFKTHLANVNLPEGACEIYFFRGGYGGLSRVENNLANFCFLMRADVAREFDSDAQKIIEKVVGQNERAFFALKDARPIHDWLAVAVDNFGKKNLNPWTNLFAVGDAGAFIDPFTGSGMLMALESAEILAGAISVNSTVEQIAARYQTEHARKFQKRLFVCSLVRRAAFAPLLAKSLITALSFGDFPRKLLARATRPSFSVSK